MAQSIYLGIDFSGGAAAWRRRCLRPTVWIAAVEAAGHPRLVELVPVQALAGTGDPFGRLVTLLRSEDYVAAGIDAPFCIPARYMPPGGHACLLAAAADLPDAADRPFPSGASLVELAASVASLETAKPLRETEKAWLSRGVNTRSALWNGPRGGAPFAAACLALLARAGRPVWPWATGPGMLVESFPAAQLKAWSLPHTGYAAPDRRAAREHIVAGIHQRIDLKAAEVALLLDYPDALDAVVAAFGAISASTSDLPAVVSPDGLISVMVDALCPGRGFAG